MQGEHAWSFWFTGSDGALSLGGLGYSSILLGPAALCYALAAVIFCRRDLPAPL